MTDFTDKSSLDAFNNAIIEEFRANDGVVGGPFEGATLLLLTSTGAKSGQPRLSPLAYLTIDGKVAHFVIRGFAGGTLQSVTDAGVSTDLATQFGQACRFASKTVKNVQKWGGGGWRAEWAIPFDALGIKPAPGLKLAFNLAVYSSENGQYHCWEGTRAETWRLDEAGFVQLK